jgi:hypothetical protein
MYLKISLFPSQKILWKNSFFEYFKISENNIINVEIFRHGNTMV